MKNKDNSASNKFNSGKGNGNSVINNHENATDYVSGTTSSSSSHKFGTKDSNTGNKAN